MPRWKGLTRHQRHLPDILVERRGLLPYVAWRVDRERGVAKISVHLAIPALSFGRRPDVILRWLKRPGDEVASLEPIARLVGGNEWLLLVPNGYSGRIAGWLAGSGSPVVPYEPFVKILLTAEPQDESEQNANDGLSETANSVRARAATPSHNHCQDHAQKESSRFSHGSAP